MDKWRIRYTGYPSAGGHVCEPIFLEQCVKHNYFRTARMNPGYTFSKKTEVVISGKKISPTMKLIYQGEDTFPGIDGWVFEDGGQGIVELRTIQVKANGLDVKFLPSSVTKYMKTYAEGIMEIIKRTELETDQRLVPVEHLFLTSSYDPKNKPLPLTQPFMNETTNEEFEVQLTYITQDDFLDNLSEISVKRRLKQWKQNLAR
jgi:hypothetical protein